MKSLKVGEVVRLSSGLYVLVSRELGKMELVPVALDETRPNLEVTPLLEASAKKYPW
jgi:hypothetical protein